MLASIGSTAKGSMTWITAIRTPSSLCIRRNGLVIRPISRRVSFTRPDRPSRMIQLKEWISTETQNGKSTSASMSGVSRVTKFEIA